MTPKATTTKSDKPSYAFYMCIPQLDSRGDKFLPMFSDTIIYKNDGATVIDGIHKPAQCKGLDPTALGVYIIDLANPDAKMIMKHMDIRVKDDSKPVIGPFYDYDEGRKAVEDSRERTRDEEIAILRAKLAASGLE